MSKIDKKSARMQTNFDLNSTNIQLKFDKKMITYYYPFI